LQNTVYDVLIQPGFSPVPFGNAAISYEFKYIKGYGYLI